MRLGKRSWSGLGACMPYPKPTNCKLTLKPSTQWCQNFMVIAAAWGGGPCGVGWWSVWRGVVVGAAWGGGRRDTGRNFFDSEPIGGPLLKKVQKDLNVG